MTGVAISPDGRIAATGCRRRPGPALRHGHREAGPRPAPAPRRGVQPQPAARRAGPRHRLQRAHCTLSGTSPAVALLGPWVHHGLCVGFSPDGAALACGTTGGRRGDEVDLWDGRAPARDVRFDPIKFILDLAFSPRREDSLRRRPRGGHPGSTRGPAVRRGLAGHPKPVSALAGRRPAPRSRAPRRARAALGPGDDSWCCPTRLGRWPSGRRRALAAGCDDRIARVWAAARAAPAEGDRRRPPAQFAVLRPGRVRADRPRRRDRPAGSPRRMSASRPAGPG